MTLIPVLLEQRPGLPHQVRFKRGIAGELFMTVALGDFEAGRNLAIEGSAEFDPVAPGPVFQDFQSVMTGHRLRMKNPGQFCKASDSNLARNCRSMRTQTR